MKNLESNNCQQEVWGGCCCSCENHLEDVMHCSVDRKDDDTECVCGRHKGWICREQFEDDDKPRYISGWPEHGYCEIYSKRKPRIAESKTQRGFEHGKFTDLYGEICSIQKSSLATDDAIWLGIDNPKLTVFENEQMGKYLITEMPKNFSVSSRMHLNREQVADLLPILQKFVETGSLF